VYGRSSLENHLYTVAGPLPYAFFAMAPLTHSLTMESLYDPGPGYHILQGDGNSPSTGNNTSEGSPPPLVPHSIPTGKPKRTTTGDQKTKAQNAKAEAGLRFFVVDHPDQLRDRTQMKKNRRHVMHNYLDKESQKPDSKDSRVRNYVRRPKSKEPDPALNSTRLTPPESEQSTTDARPTSELDEDSGINRKVARHSNIFARSNSWIRSDSQLRTAKDAPPLVEGIGGRIGSPVHAKYMQSAAHEIPFLLDSSNLGGILEPFNIWPEFDSSPFDLHEMKFSCMQRFGTQRATVHWIPTMLKARHAFLSTLCISSAHDHIMRRNLLPLDGKTADAYMQRLNVRMGVMSLINASLNDPEMSVSDETIVAVLHVLASEIMGCDDRSMRIHQTGLHGMVQQRGGLKRLGLDGQLAGMLTITMLMLAALRETLPHTDFLSYASELQTNVSTDSRKELPESPVYCRSSGYDNVSRVLSKMSATYKLLERLRLLTDEFCKARSPTTSDAPNTPDSLDSGDKISDMCQAIFAAAPAWELDFHDMNERYTYESVRLGAVVYAYALSKRISFSQAAANISKRKTRPASIVLPDDSTPMPILLKNALMRTDISHCWDHLGGILFWLTLVGGATANPGPFTNEERESEDEDARKWITAICVRCTVLLSFEFGNVMMETLKRIIGIEAHLTKAKRSGRRTWTEIDFEAGGVELTEPWETQQASVEIAKGFVNTS
jgi:hypothetical protein